MKRASGVPYVVLKPLHSSVNPMFFNSYLGVDAKFLFKSRWPYVELNKKRYGVEIPGVGLSTDKEYMEMCEDVVYPHNKRSFLGLVEKHKKESLDLLYLNFLRDCIKAEVALQQSCVYITHDRLAYLYYKVIGGESGFLLTVEDTAYRVSI